MVKQYAPDLLIWEHKKKRDKIRAKKTLECTKSNCFLKNFPPLRPGLAPSKAQFHRTNQNKMAMPLRQSKDKTFYKPLKTEPATPPPRQLCSFSMTVSFALSRMNLSGNSFISKSGTKASSLC